MKKFFLLFALCAFALTACDTEPNGGQSGKIKLTSSSVVDFESLGGQGEITYTFVEDETRATEVTAVCVVDWITDVTVHQSENKVTFNVAPNTDEERMATIKVQHGSDSFQVMIMQEGTQAADVNFTATHLNGTYWGKYPGKSKGFNYLIILSDQQSIHYLTKAAGSTEYRFNIYSDVSSAFNTTHRVPVGTYKIDHQSTGNPGTIDGYKDESYYLSAADTDTPYADATMVVTEDSIIVDVTFFNGETHHVEYYGSTTYEPYIEGTFADVYPVSQYTSDININVTGGRMNLYYRGDHYGKGCDVWMAELIQQTNPYNGVYMIFDLIIPKGLGGSNNSDSIVGDYKFHDANTTSYEYSIPVGRLRDDCLQMHAWYMWCVQSQIDMSKAAPMTSGTVKVSKNGTQDYTFDIDSTDDNGNRIFGTFQGTILNIYNQCYE